jgi:hypothetical protein
VSSRNLRGCEGFGRCYPHILQQVAMRLTLSACLRDGALLERVASSTKAF